MTRKPIRALTIIDLPLLIFSSLPVEVKMMKPPKTNIAKRIKPAMVKIKGRMMFMISAGVGLPLSSLIQPVNTP